MTQTTVGADVHQALNVHLHALAEVAFNFALRFDHAANTAKIILSQIPYPRIKINLRFRQNRRRTRSSNSVYVRKTDLSALIRRKIDTCYTSHLFDFGLRISECRIKNNDFFEFKSKRAFRLTP